jgi:bla regulator protein BlaR1
MSPNYLSELWAPLASAVGNHLWQSTIVVIAAGLLTLALRRNHARARYWLWLAASIKFLIPFSLLVFIGSRLPISRAPARSTAGMYTTIEQIAQPFALATTGVGSSPHQSALTSNFAHFLPPLVAAVWLIGFLAVLSVWIARWRRISAAVSKSIQLSEGREWDALRRIERSRGIQNSIPIFLSSTSLEPGIFGIARPVLLWPEGISVRLEDAHLETILAHEVSHVHRRDNLAAAIHMFVEAVFWFYPLVWWLGMRLVDERERACDEEVLSAGAGRQVYAESILKICEFCMSSPLPCVSGVTGADLKKRIARIMSETASRNLDIGRKLLLTTAAALVIVVPVAFGLIHAAPTRAASQSQDMPARALAYESVSIKASPTQPDKSANAKTNVFFRPDGFTGKSMPMQMLIREAYGVQNYQITGAPEWITSEMFDVDLKAGKSTGDELQKLSPEQRKLEQQRMLQALLADRLNLTLHRETKDLPIYELVIATDGPKLQKAKPGDTYSNGLKGPGGEPGIGVLLITGREGPIKGQGVSITSLVNLLSFRLGRTVIDETGLLGNYDFTLQWAPDSAQPAIPNGAEAGTQAGNTKPSLDSSTPAILTAIQEQLGLRLESREGPTEILVIDHVEAPTDK